jgi:CRISPR system Cascade subunit CasC
MFVELHMLQSFAPSNLNRDDTNSPKDCEFGGVRRARISSQCIKRAIRTAPVFAETTRVEIGIRTKWLIGRLRGDLVAAGQGEDETTAILTEFVPKFASKLDRDGERTAVLLYLSQGEIDNIVERLLAEWDNLPEGADKLAKALVKAHKGHTSAPDIALFGRMLAEKPELSLDAACQVAHAISTHRITMDMDFFTAVDDLNPEETAGAGMMGFIGYNSACFYRYARIDWKQLQQNLDGDAEVARRTVEGFLRATVVAVPSGKQASFAANSPPSLLLAVVRRDGMGWSLVNAFERPVHADRHGGLVAPSALALDTYWHRLCTIYGDKDLVQVSVVSLDPNLPLERLTPYCATNVDQWVREVVAALPNGEDAV